jgi:8-amino-7-oxononanoate synthase
MLPTDSDPNIALEERRQTQRLRKLKSVVSISPRELWCDGKIYLNFSSNDYLGLSQHPLIKQRAIEYINRYGVGSGSSRLVSGNNVIYESLEARLAELKGSEAALVFSSGYQLNSTILPVLASVAGNFLCDHLVHNSLLTGAINSKAGFHRFRHNDCRDLERRLAEIKTKNATGWIVTQSVFGMDGDLASLDEITTLGADAGFHLFVDEAHATGVFGENGMGLVSSSGDNKVVMGTFGKGCGSFGAYVTCSEQMKDYLVNFCSGFIYTTALPPPVLGAIEAALELIPKMEQERQQLLQLAHETRAALTSLGFAVGNSASQIIPVIVGTDANAISLSDWLLGHQIYVPAIRPPTVPDGTARLRLSLSALHSPTDIAKLVSVLKQWQPCEAIPSS